MQYKLLIVNTLYPNYIKSYYNKYPDIKNLSYKEQYEHILNNATEMITSYTNSFNEIGIKTRCIIFNAPFLQKQWLKEKGIKLKNTKKIIFEQIKDYQPDVLWIGNKNLVQKEFIELIKTNIKSVKLIFSYVCSPYNKQDIQHFKELDFMLSCTPGYVNDYKKNGIKSFLSYHAFDEKILTQINNNTLHKKVNEIIFTGSLFTGSGYHQERIKLIEKILQSGIELKVYGNLEDNRRILLKKMLLKTYKLLNNIKLGRVAAKIPYLNKFNNTQTFISYSKHLKKIISPPIFGIEMLQILKNSKIVLNQHGEVAKNYAGNMRLFEATGIGTCLLTDQKSNLHELFAPEEIITYSSPEECIDKINWLIKNPEEREKIALAGQKRTLKDHTVKQRCKKISEIIENELKNINK